MERNCHLDTRVDTTEAKIQYCSPLSPVKASLSS